jgi:succinate dehydrogenase/fumarate reductase flavoprotein subunit
LTARAIKAADLIVAGAGMGGLVAAAQARELGATVTVYEKGNRPGGSMLLSSGVVWRHRDYADFLRECPGGDPELQRLVHHNLDRDIAWLEGLGARVVSRSTGNPDTAGARFCTTSLVDVLARRAGQLKLEEPLRELPSQTPVILATGGFQADCRLVRRHVTPYAKSLLLRATPWSAGDGLRLGLEAGAVPTSGLDEFYGRNMPAPPARVREADFVELAQLYARWARVENSEGEGYEPRHWSEIDVVQWTSRQPGASAYYHVAEAHLETRFRGRTIGDMIAAAEHAGAPVRRKAGTITVQVVAGITTTLGGLKVDTAGKAAPGLYATGADVGGIASGGYSSGLAAALVLGRVAAASALGER